MDQGETVYMKGATRPLPARGFPAALRERWLALLLAAVASGSLFGATAWMAFACAGQTRTCWPLVMTSVVLLIFAAMGWNNGRGNRRLHLEIERRIGAEQDALRLAQHDPLTGLRNRRVLDDCLSAPLAAGRRRTVLIIDIDRFKEINDWRGHDAGDAILVEVARRLETIAAPLDATTVRLGGDEFLLAFDLDADSTDPSHIVARIEDAVRVPVPHRDDPIHVTASVGIATASERAGERQALLRRADEAMYQAKRARRVAVPAAVAAAAAEPSKPESEPEDADGPSMIQQRRLLERAMLRSGRTDGRPIFVAAVEIDRLAGIRAVIGAERAALLLRTLSHRAIEIGEDTCAARLTGETLGVGFRAADADEARALLGRLRDHLQEEVDLGGNMLDLTFTIGFAGPDDLSGIRRLTDQAQTALYHAHAGREKLVQFVPADPAMIDPLSLMRDLRRDLERGDLWLCYQPKMLARSGEMDSMEALIRWRHPELGLVSPDQFIGIAEQTGHIREVTRWVLARAMEDQSRLIAAGHRLPVYVNISARLLSDNAFVQEAIAAIGSRASEFGFEITETAVLEDPATAINNLQKIRDAGIHIAIDDYGAGMSSLSYLKQLPAHELKIDRMFVSELTNNHRDPLLVRSTIDLAHGLGMRVTAEGVDTPSALALLKVMGCDLLQGYLIAKPMPLDELLLFLSDGSRAKRTADVEIASFLSGHEYWSASPAIAIPAPISALAS